MNVSPRLSFFASNIRRREQVEAAKADVRHHRIVDGFGSIEHLKVEEEALMEKVFEAITNLRGELKGAAHLSETDMSNRLNDLCEAIDASIHDNGVTREAWERMTEQMS